MKKLSKRKDFLEYIPDDLFIKLATPTGDVTLSIKDFLEQHLTEISKQPDVKNISYFKLPNI